MQSVIKIDRKRSGFKIGLNDFPFTSKYFCERKYLSVFLLILNRLIFRKFVNNLFSLC